MVAGYSEHAEYAELLDAAAKAMRALLMRTEPGTAIECHTAYARILKAQERHRTAHPEPDESNVRIGPWREWQTPQRQDAKPRDVGVSAQHQAQLDRWNEHRARWTALSKHEREHLLVGLLGDDALTIPELTMRVRDRLGECAVCEGHVRNVVTNLLRAGELVREPETFRKTKIRYRYSRAPLDGAIVELDRAFRDEPTKGA